MLHGINGALLSEHTDCGSSPLFCYISCFSEGAATLPFEWNNMYPF